MTHRTNLSVIICTKDRPDDIGRCLDSLLAQTVKEFELIVVDSSGDNKTKLVLEKKLKGNTNIRLRYFTSQAGTSLQRNIGITESSGEILVFLDDDVSLESDYLLEYARLYEMDSAKQVGGVGGVFLGVKPYSLSGRIFREIFLMPCTGEEQTVLPSGYSTDLLSPVDSKEVKKLASGNCSYRREVFSQFRFDEFFEGYGYMEDVDLSYRVSTKYKLIINPRVRLTHYQSAQGREDPKKTQVKEVIDHYYFFKKNMPKTLKTWLCFFWSEIGCLIYRLLRGKPNLFLFRCIGILEVIRDIMLNKRKDLTQKIVSRRMNFWAR